MIRTIFMGSGSFALPSLQSLIVHPKIKITACYTSNIPGQSRNAKNEIIEFAGQNNLLLHTPTTLKGEEIFTQISNHKADLLIVVSYGFLIPEKILDLFKYGAYNLHPSSLPKFRGAAPIERSIIAGETDSHVGLIKMVKQLDAGDIVYNAPFSLTNIDAKSALEISAKIGAGLIDKLVDELSLGHIIKSSLQEETGIIYADKITKEELLLNPEEDVELLARKIRAFTSCGYAKIILRDLELKILQADFIKEFHGKAFGSFEIIQEGKKKKLAIFCSNGILFPNLVQRPGKSPSFIQDFLNGFTIS